MEEDSASVSSNYTEATEDYAPTPLGAGRVSPSPSPVSAQRPRRTAFDQWRIAKCGHSADSALLHILFTREAWRQHQQVNETHAPARRRPCRRLYANGGPLARLRKGV